MKNLFRHTEWLSLIEISGPFITVSMLEKAFPQGLEAVETPRRQKLRAAYDEWREAVDEDDRLLVELHREWSRLVLTEMLEYDDESLVPASEWKGGSLAVSSQEHAGSFSPDWIVRSPGVDKPRLFISIQAPDTDFESIQRGDGWPVSLQERMTLLCHTHGVRLGLLINGERWMLVNAPIGSTSSHISWYARLWFQEPITFKAFQSLLGVRRCFGPTEETLEALLDESLKHHEEVTDTLGEQVRRAVEVLVQCLDKADADRNRELLRDVRPVELYEAGLTVMMRLVFVLCAEERGLLLSGDPIYDQCYAVSTLRGQLAEEGRLHGPEVLERRHDAWARLLAVFRAVYGGIEHESLRMPALGGSLFDPDRFPFLEGRAKGTHWRNNSAAPLPIDNRTVLLLLNSLQILEQSGGALLLSYRALDVEQIGHVYEGLLEHTAARVPRVTLGLVGTQKVRNPNIALAELESARLDGEAALMKLVTETTGRSESAIRNGLSRSIDETLFGRIMGVCGGDMDVASRIRPFVNLLRTDAWEDPIVYREKAFMVTLGANRRETGTHYTPKSLTESIVKTTLEPVVYIGPSDGKLREEWTLRKSRELFELKVCDPAMGSGAFLVQACRYLGEKLVEAWLREEAAGKTITVDGEAKDELGASEPMPSSLDERLTIARRLVAERCLYGVDINPLAVELAKLAIWLVTLAKGRPFGFLDHNLRHGDSLLGIHRLDQLTRLNMNLDAGQHQFRIFGQNIETAVKEAIELRKRLWSIPIRDIRDVETMARLDQEVRKKLESVETIADAMIGEALRCGGNARSLETALETLAIYAGEFLDGNEKMGEQIARQAKTSLSIDLADGKPPRKPFHWALEFPEVFAKESEGFDAIVGNPPFLGGTRISYRLGDAYLKALYAVHPYFGNRADLVSLFFSRSASIVSNVGFIGLIGTDTIAEGDTREVGLRRIIDLGGTIYNAIRSMPWPGTASQRISLVHISMGHWDGRYVLNGKQVSRISVFLDESIIDNEPYALLANEGLSYEGAKPAATGFVLTPEEARSVIQREDSAIEVIYPYLRGEDLNNRPDQSPCYFVIDFRGRSLVEAEKYPVCLSIVREKVKPVRDKVKRKAHREKWWMHGELRPGLYASTENLKEVIVHAFTSKHIAFAIVPNTSRFAAPMNVFAFCDRRKFAILQSNIHITWVFKYCSTMGATIRYTRTDVFDTFPFPENKDTALAETGKRYNSFRSKLMLEDNYGLTSLYNLFNDPSVDSSKINELRFIHTEMDYAVAYAYGWEDLDLGHDFYDTKQGVRFTISEEVRREVLQRLLKLNHKRHDEEVQQSLHTKKSAKKMLISGNRETAPKQSLGYNLFNAIYSNTNTSEDDLSQAILQFLRTNEGWYGKDDILTGSGIAPTQWQATINRLLEERAVERQGERRVARYRAVKQD